MTEKNKEVVLPWWYNGGPVDESQIPEWAIGMVYIIVRLEDMKMYVGKKLLQSTNKKRIGVREKAATKTRMIYKVVKRGSNWQQYNSSNRALAAEIRDNPEKFRKSILEWAFSKKNLHWLEVKYQVIYEVMEKESYNDNIGGRIWRKDISKELHDQYKEERGKPIRKPSEQVKQ